MRHHPKPQSLPGCCRYRARLRQEKLIVYIIDDGSDEPAGSALAALHDRENGVVVRRLEENRGKGCAVVAAMKLPSRTASAMHCRSMRRAARSFGLPRFLELAARYPMR